MYWTLVSRRLRGKVEVNNPTPTEKAPHRQPEPPGLQGQGFKGSYLGSTSLRRLQARRCLFHVRIMKGSGSVRIIGVWRCCTYKHLPFYSLLNLSHTRSTCCTCDVCTRAKDANAFSFVLSRYLSSSMPRYHLYMSIKMKRRKEEKGV